MDHNAIGKLFIHQGFLSSDSELKALKEISKEKGVDITFESIKVMLGLALTSLLT